MKTAIFILTIASLLAAAPAEQKVRLEFLSKDGMSKIGYYMPQRLQLDSKKPDALTKVPDDLSAPLYGVLPFAGKTIHVIVDEPDGKSSRLFVDSNGNKDLTDDPKPTWEAKPYPSRDGKQLSTYMGSSAVSARDGQNKRDYGLTFYRFDKNDPARAVLKNTLLYYRDYAWQGEIPLGDKKVKALLSDEMATGDFRGDDTGKSPRGSGVNLLLDVNGNGSFDARGESFDVRKPFNVGGTTWEIKDLSPAGDQLTIVPSSQTVEEILPPPDHSVGKPIMAFKAKTMDGKEVNFPADYKGKVVLLDFWATWCGPCMAEMPNVVQAYDKFHDQGFEILGISLDNPNDEQKIKDVEHQMGMKWRQVYDGKGWEAEIATKYGISSIPVTFLVDGTTGKVLADGNSLRAELLAPAIEKAIKK